MSLILACNNMYNIYCIYIYCSVSDPDPPGSACFWPVRIRRKCGSGSGSGSWLKMPISLTIWQVFCLVDFSFFKFILKNAHFLNILVNFGSCGKMLKIFLFLNFFFENFTLTIFINALDPDPDPDPDPHQNFRSDPDPDPLQNKADPKP